MMVIHEKSETMRILTGMNGWSFNLTWDLIGAFTGDDEGRWSNVTLSEWVSYLWAELLSQCTNQAYIYIEEGERKQKRDKERELVL